MMMMTKMTTMTTMTTIIIIIIITDRTVQLREIENFPKKTSVKAQSSSIYKLNRPISFN